MFLLDTCAFDRKVCFRAKNGDFFGVGRSGIEGDLESRGLVFGGFLDGYSEIDR